MPGPYLFAGDRSIAVDALRMLIDHGDPPAILCVSDRATASHADALAEVFREAGGEHVITGSVLHGAATMAHLRELGLELALSVHLPELIRAELLGLPARGWLNLHPAFLPFNRGWHTPSWAILEGTPAGVTIHEMVEDVDAGRILARREVPISPADTAHSLYQRLLAEELRLLEDTWPVIRGSDPWPTVENDVAAGSVHRRTELLSDAVQVLDLGSPTTAGQVLDRLRALTTDRWHEAARFERDGKSFRVRVELREDDGIEPPTA